MNLSLLSIIFNRIVLFVVPKFLQYLLLVEYRWSNILIIIKYYYYYLLTDTSPIIEQRKVYIEELQSHED